MKALLLKLRLTREWEPYDVTPRGFGLCWRDYDYQRIVIAPIPLNIAFRLAYGAWLFLRRPFVFLDGCFKADHYRKLYEKKFEENAELRSELFEQSMQMQERVA